MSVDFTVYLRSCQQRVQGLLQTELESLPSYAGRLREAMIYASLLGGKRIRPLLCYASAEAAGTTMQSADGAACAVELIHCYSLIHDDLPAMDNDDLRRGIPTVHKAFDEATAILAGDALQALAFQIIARGSAITPEIRLQMLEILTAAAGYQGMVAGQAIDFAATGTALNLQQLETMHSLKTGALIRASVQLGALSSGHISKARFNALSRYADCIGLSFQVQDDILDVVGDTATIGKRQGADQAMNKPTYVALLGLPGAQKKARELTDQAVAELADFGSEADMLRNIARYIVARDS
jgi:geranylgeranyl diphosphate synthase, type II